ncbi:MAG TPA: DUF4198 domain-containing protein [Thermoanaerobaculia bacterium]|nr:DUF4198 domain-containing protein [Thermoanaerobaculia bacterium]
MNRRLSALALLLLVAASAHAHDFWIEPSSFTPAAGEVVSVRLRVGEHLQGEPVPRRTGRIERFFARSATGEREVPGQDNRDPAGVLPIRDRGTTVVAYRSLPTRTELAAAKFESYLREEGLELIIDERKKRGESNKTGSELYSRAAKTLIHSGGGDPVDQVLGLRFELVRKGNAFQALFEGKPLPNALVVAIRRGDAANPTKARTDAAGMVSFPSLGRGEWLVKTVHMVRAPAPAIADWESIWASVTFAVP